MAKKGGGFERLIWHGCPRRLDTSALIRRQLQTEKLCLWKEGEPNLLALIRYCIFNFMQLACLWFLHGQFMVLQVN